MVTLWLPGLPDPWKNLRVPVFAFDRCSVWKERTIDDALRIIQWSPHVCAINVRPSSRHDGSEWPREERRARAKVSGKPIGCAPLVCQVVGDWVMLKEVFRFPPAQRIKWMLLPLQGSA